MLHSWRRPSWSASFRAALPQVLAGQIVVVGCVSQALKFLSAHLGEGDDLDYRGPGGKLDVLRGRQELRRLAGK